MSIIIKQFIEKSRIKFHSNHFLGCALSSGSCTVTLSYCSLHEPVPGDLFVLLPFLTVHSSWTKYQETYFYCYTFLIFTLHEPGTRRLLFVLLPFFTVHSTWTRYQETVTVIHNCNYRVTFPILWILSFCLSTLQFIEGTYI